MLAHEATHGRLTHDERLARQDRLDDYTPADELRAHVALYRRRADSQVSPAAPITSKEATRA